jgi:hypothetical protein
VAFIQSLEARRKEREAKVEASLRKLVVRPGKGEYNPDEQVLAFEGFTPAKSTDIDVMLRKDLNAVAKGHIKNMSTMKIDELRKAIKVFMEKHPNVIQLPNAIPVKEGASQSQSASEQPAAATTSSVLPLSHSTNAPASMIDTFRISDSISSKKPPQAPSKPILSPEVISSTQKQPLSASSSSRVPPMAADQKLTTTSPTSDKYADMNGPNSYLGRYVRKLFRGYGYCVGTVTSYNEYALLT